MISHRCGPWWQNLTAVCLFVRTNGRTEWSGRGGDGTCGVWRTAPHRVRRDPAEGAHQIPNPPGAKNSSLQNTHQDVIEVFRPKLTELTNPYHLWNWSNKSFKMLNRTKVLLLEIRSATVTVEGWMWEICLKNGLYVHYHSWSFWSSPLWL